MVFQQQVWQVILLSFFGHCFFAATVIFCSHSLESELTTPSVHEDAASNLDGFPTSARLADATVKLKMDHFLLLMATVSGGTALRNVMIPCLVENLRRLGPGDCITQALTSTQRKIKEMAAQIGIYQLAEYRSTLDKKLCIGKEMKVDPTFPLFVRADEFTEAEWEFVGGRNLSSSVDGIWYFDDFGTNEENKKKGENAAETDDAVGKKEFKTGEGEEKNEVSRRSEEGEVRKKIMEEGQSEAQGECKEVNHEGNAIEESEQVNDGK